MSVQEWGSTADTFKAERVDSMAKRLAADAHSCPSCRELIVDINVNGFAVAFDVQPGLAEVVGLDNTDRTYLLPAGYARPKHACPTIEELERRMRTARVPFVARFRELLHLGADAPTIQADPLSAAYCAANDRWRAARYGISLEELEEQDRRSSRGFGFPRPVRATRDGFRSVDELEDGL